MPSTVISSMHYDATGRTLTIVYQAKRGMYRYYDVSPEEYEEFRTAPSKGTYLNQTFKSRRHPYERIPATEGVPPAVRGSWPDERWRGEASGRSERPLKRSS